MSPLPPDFVAPSPPLQLEDLQDNINAALSRERRVTSVLQGRPGELTERYTSSRTGERDSAPLDHDVVTTPRGLAIAITGAGLIALRDRINVTDGLRRTMHATFYKATNPSDPAGANVRFRIQWLDNEKAALSQTPVYDEVLTVSDGLQEVEVIIGPGQIEPPSGAIYAVPFVQTFDADGITHVEQIEVRSGLAAPAITHPNGFQYPEETIPDFPETNIIHVATNGSDALEGETRRGAVQSLERAIEVAGDNPNDKFALSVHPGAYVTQGNLDVPDNVTAAFGNHNARSTRLIPDTGAEERSCFRLGNGGYVEGFSFEGGWRTDDLEDPTVGVISFRPGAVIARTVYVHNVTFWRPSPPVLIPPPLDAENGNPLVGRGPLCVLADKSVVSQYSPFPQIMLWGATPTAQNNIGYCAKNGGFINGINAVGLWSHRGYLALNGGEMILTNCASQFGDWTLDADGFREQVVAFQTSPANLSVQTGAADAIIANRESLIDAMWSELSSSSGSFSGSEELTRRDAGFFLDAIEGDLRSGQQEGATIFAEGMFDWKGDFVGNPNNKPWYIEAWENLRDGINGLGISAAAQAMVTALVDEVIIATVNSSSPNKRIVPSQITSLFHQWNNAGSGVNGRALRRPPLPVRDTIRERNLGRVIWNGQDDQRRLYLNEQFVINGDTGQAEGGAVDRTILPRARLAALIAQGQN